MVFCLSSSHASRTICPHLFFLYFDDFHSGAAAKSVSQHSASFESPASCLILVRRAFLLYPSALVALLTTIARLGISTIGMWDPVFLDVALSRLQSHIHFNADGRSSRCLGVCQRLAQPSSAASVQFFPEWRRSLAAEFLPRP
ncbi:unnamed protein product [Prorocentrum cordatum]|uniref:Uncharacterized protein n=1 Tax=Prorocentrum cordatum TaxID=2364126 RepID=A0ABN9PAA6_9DINO|nr:unnamed protein product [Polarella glacialis]